jgi:predicted ATPase
MGEVISTKFSVKEFEGLKNIEWTIPDGLSLLIGPNGGGKSRLLRLPKHMGLRGYYLYRGYNLREVRTGLILSSGRRLGSDGVDAIGVDENLRYADRAEDLSWVKTTMKLCFPTFVDWWFTIDVNNHVSGWMRTQPPGREPVDTSFQETSSGMIVALLHLFALAVAKAGDTLAFDHFEAHLHPEVVLTLLQAFSDRLCDYDISVIIATQSPAVVHWFDPRAESVLIVDDRLSTIPSPLLSQVSQVWLTYFRLGDLFMQGSFGGSALPAPASVDS